MQRARDDRQEPPGVTSVLCLLKGRLWLLPVVTAGWLFLSIWISYGIAVNNNHVEAHFPWISYTAIEAPERCVFGQMVNIGAVMLGLNVVFRYLFVKSRLLQLEIGPGDIWFKVNLAGLFMGILSAFGLSMIANFQTDVLRAAHWVGAGLAFFLGGIYCVVQTLLSYKVPKKSIGEKVLMILQVINCIVLWVMLIIFLATTLNFYIRQRHTERDLLRGIYLTSTITEWLLAFSILTFTLTFAHNFKNMRVDGPRINETPTHQGNAVYPST